MGFLYDILSSCCSKFGPVNDVFRSNSFMSVQLTPLSETCPFSLRNFPTSCESWTNIFIMYDSVVAILTCNYDIVDFLLSKLNSDGREFLSSQARQKHSNRYSSRSSLKWVRRSFVHHRWVSLSETLLARFPLIIWLIFELIAILFFVNTFWSTITHSIFWIYCVSSSSLILCPFCRHT